MSSTLRIPVNYALIRNTEGELVLHPSIKCESEVIESNGLVKIEATFQITLSDGFIHQVEFGKESQGNFFDSYMIFTGFYTTGLKIIKDLGVPNKEAEWY